MAGFVSSTLVCFCWHWESGLLPLLCSLEGPVSDTMSCYTVASTAAHYLGGQTLNAKTLDPKPYTLQATTL